MIDYQWPIVSNYNCFEFNEKNNYIDIDSYQEIEKYFSNHFNANCYLLSSGRSAISAVLKYYEINRSKIIFGPKWSSHCLWDIVSRYADPTCILTNDVDVAINVHKWGYVHKLDSSAIKINDSVDSLLLGNYKPDKDVDFEIISLPKIIGSYSGGLVITDNKEFKKLLDNLRCANEQHSLRAGQYKYKSIVDAENYDYWNSLESGNYCLDNNMIENIRANLNNYGVNKAVIKKRLLLLSEKIGEPDINLPNDRLPSNYPVKVNKVSSTKLQSTMIRHFNFNQDYNSPNYLPAYLIPLHFGISDEEFQLIFEEVLYVNA